MKTIEGFLPGALGIVLSDIFLTATAAILVLLVVLQDRPIVPVPIQADIVMSCLQDERYALAIPGQTDTPPRIVSDLQDIGPVVLAIAPSPRIIQSVALVPGQNGLSVPCIDAVQRAVRRWNLSLGETDEARSAIGLAIVTNSPGVFE
jgi:hypothetical protein